MASVLGLGPVGRFVQFLRASAQTTIGKSGSLRKEPNQPRRAQRLKLALTQAWLPDDYIVSKHSLFAIPQKSPCACRR
jgi:hypothetical protein